MQLRCESVLLLALVAVGHCRVPQSALQVTLSHVTRHEAQVDIVKTNSSASQVVVTLTRSGNSSEFQQLKAQLDPSLQPELQQLRFAQLAEGAAYRICSSVWRDGEVVRNGECFTIQTFQARSSTKAIVTGVVAALVFLAVVAALCGAYRCVRSKRHSKTMIVTEKPHRQNGASAQNGVENPAADVAEN